MHILSMLDHKSRLNCIYWYAIYLVICVRIDCTHSRSRVTYFTGCDTTRPGGGGGRPGVGLSPMLLYRCWAGVGPAGVAAWAVMGSWPGAVCELFSPFEHAKYQYLCKNYHDHYYYSWQSLVKALTYLFLNSVLHWVRYEHSIALVSKKSNHIMYAIPQELVTLVSHRGTDKYFFLQYPFTAAKYLFFMYLSTICILNLLMFMW